MTQVADPTPGEAGILVAAADIFLRAIVREALADQYPLVVAKTGTAALQMARSQAPRLALVAIDLPDLDGYEVCRRLRRGDGTQAIPVVFLAADGAPQGCLHCFAAGIEDYVIAPFDPMEIRAKVGQLLDLFSERRRIAAPADTVARDTELGPAVARISRTLDGLDHAQRERLLATRRALRNLSERMEHACSDVPPDGGQEELVAGVVREGMDGILAIQGEVAGLQSVLSTIVQELKSLAKTLEPAPPG